MKYSGPIQLTIFVGMIIMMLATVLLFVWSSQASPPLSQQSEISETQAVVPITNNPCTRSQWQIQTQNFQSAITADFKQLLSQSLVACDPQQNANLIVQGAFRPSSVFLHGFPSEAELSANKRTRDTAKVLQTFGYSDWQISQFSVQSSQNGISVILLPAE